MANHKSALKAHRKSEQRRLANRAATSRIKTAIKKLEDLIAHQSYSAAKEFFAKTESVIMQGVKHNLLKLNTAARKVSRLSRLLKAAAAGSKE